MSATTVFLGRLLGLYLVVISLGMLANRHRTLGTLDEWRAAGRGCCCIGDRALGDGDGVQRLTLNGSVNDGSDVSDTVHSPGDGRRPALRPFWDDRHTLSS
jgi:hypothetical protein